MIKYIEDNVTEFCET